MRIRQLQRRRDELWSIAGGSSSAANLYRAFVDGKRTPSATSLMMACAEGYDLMDRYRSLLAAKLAASAIAKAQARCMTEEIRELKANGWRTAMGARALACHGGGVHVRRV
ncbi:hypothetical protein PQR29_04660 [Paraburkholderia strydomiana]|uniref:hypothetical protein n=1 Tax=Paraburkholderia strydomiana TaxID=1245417 RepID=UPI0038B7B8FB